MTQEARIIARLVMAASATRRQFHHAVPGHDDLHGAIAEGEAYLAGLQAPALTFTAIGKPEPKGSARAFLPKGWTRPVVTSDNPKIKAWQKAVAEAAVLAILDKAGEGARGPQAYRTIEGPVILAVDFHLERPQRVRGHEPHVSSPDLDKLVRSVGDALTGTCWADDAQVDVLVARKGYAAPGTVPRAEVVVGRSYGGLTW